MHPRHHLLAAIAGASLALTAFAPVAQPSDDPGAPSTPAVADDPAATAAPADGGPIAFAPTGSTTDRFAAATTPEVVELPAEDGVVLHGRLFRPDTSSDPAWRQPVILVHSPYYNQRTRTNTRSLDLVEFFTPKGYAVALTDVRGTGNSGGCASQDGEDQARDFATWVDWLAAQEWSNGAVGGYGKSYDAETQNAGFRYSGDGLRTAVTVAGIASLYDIGFHDGVPLGAGALLGAVVYTPISFDLPTDQRALPRYPEKVACQPANYVAGVDLRGDMTPYWAEREFRLGLEETSPDLSVLHVHGWNDGTVSPIGLDDWYDDLPGFTRAIWGQWGHFYPYDAPSSVSREDWYATIHAWFDRFLLDLDTGVESWPPVQTQAEDGTWTAARSFAQLGAERVLALATDGRLAAPAGDGEPAPDVASSAAVSENGSTTFTSEPFVDGLRLSGQAYVDLELTLDTPDAHVVFTLAEVRADGSTRQLTDGAISALHRESLSEPLLLAPTGEALPYRLQSMPFDRTIAPGSRLRLTLTGGGSGYLAANTRWTGDVALDGASSLRLPVAEVTCGVDVASTTARPAADCPLGVPAYPAPTDGFDETSRGPIG